MTTDRQIIKTMTGEVFLPIRLYYNLHSKSGLQARFLNLRCMNYDHAGDRWTWLYDGEAKNLKFSAPYSSIPPHKRPIILGSFYSRVDGQMYLDVGSVERAIKAIEFSTGASREWWQRLNMLRFIIKSVDACQPEQNDIGFCRLRSRT